MKITEAELKAIIDEEIQNMIDEGVLDRLKAKGSGAIAKLNPFADKGDAALRQVISLMGSYGNHLLKLQQKLQKDAAKLGIETMPDIQKALNGINQTRQMVVKTAKEAPRSERFKAAVAKAAAEQSGQQLPAQQQQVQPQTQQQVQPQTQQQVQPQTQQQVQSQTQQRAAAPPADGEEPEGAKPPVRKKARKPTPRIGKQVREDNQ